MPVQPSVASHGSEVVHPPRHCILTVNGSAAGAPLKACLPMTRMLALYSTVNVIKFEPSNAF